MLKYECIPSEVVRCCQVSTNILYKITMVSSQQPIILPMRLVLQVLMYVTVVKTGGKQHKNYIQKNGYCSNQGHSYQCREQSYLGDNEKPGCKSEGKCQFFIDLVLSLILVKACFSFCVLKFSYRSTKSRFTWPMKRVANSNLLGSRVLY